MSEFRLQAIFDGVIPNMMFDDRRVANWQIGLEAEIQTETSPKSVFQ